MIAGALPLMATAAAAQDAPTDAAKTDMTVQVPAIAPYRRMTLGAFTVTTLLAGLRPLESPQETFGMNVTPEEFAEASKAAFIPEDKSMNFFTPTVVQTGEEVILFDTGLSPEGITTALMAAGISPEDVTTVVITHMHGDHIGGLSTDTLPTFPNARYIAGQIEFDHWAAAGNEGFDAKVRPLSERMTLIEDGTEIVPGITAMLAAGHTPGHMIFMLESEGAKLLLTVDTANHYVWSLGYPDWEVRFDADKAMAAQTRRKVFGMLAEERIPFIGYHMPFPGVGYVETAGDGFRFVAASYQLDV
jgi:glyoxylase-like metal-dependent hydrolase (beta-lactamase superfamily II)